MRQKNLKSENERNYYSLINEPNIISEAQTVAFEKIIDEFFSKCRVAIKRVIQRK
jgi:hypothetical protein